MVWMPGEIYSQSLPPLSAKSNKTDRTRVTYPCPVEWFDRFKVSQFTVPTSTSSTARDRGYIPTLSIQTVGVRD
jgi:hypothetical protein